MPAVTIVIGAIVLGVIVGFTLVLGAPYLAVPIVAIVLVVLGLGELRRRRMEAGSMQGFREQAKAEPIEFTERDKQTTVDSERS